MKTSNKLLITLAVVLLTVPLGIMVLIAKTHRVDQNTYHKIINGESQGSQETTGLIKTYPTGTFSKVTLIGLKDDVLLGVKVVQSNQSSFKVTKSLSENIQYQIDATGNLTIKLNGTGRAGGMLILFAPNVTKIGVDNVSLSDVDAKGDSLAIEIVKAGQVHIGESCHVNRLNVVEKPYQRKDSFPVTDVNFRDVSIENVKVDLIFSNLSAYYCKFKNVDLKIVASKVDFDSGDDKAVQTINNLQLNSVGQSEVSFKNINIEKASGSLSNETKIQMPTVNLKQILTK